MLSPSGYNPERKTRTVTADRRVDTAALLGVVAFIGLAVFLLWDRHHSLRQARHTLVELQHQSQRDHCFVDVAAPSSRIQLCRHMLPSLSLTALGR
jgi:hypothetical protein